MKTLRMIRLCATIAGFGSFCGCTVNDRQPANNDKKLQANKALARWYYERIVSTGSIEELSEVIAPDYVEIHEGVRHAVGLEGAREHILGVRKTYPDLRLVVEQQIAEEDWVATVVTAHGTHRGTWMGMKPTNRPVVITAVNVDRVVEGRIAEHRGAANLLGPLLEIGAIQVVDHEFGKADTSQ